MPFFEWRERERERERVTVLPKDCNQVKTQKVDPGESVERGRSQVIKFT